MSVVRGTRTAGTGVTDLGELDGGWAVLVGGVSAGDRVRVPQAHGGGERVVKSGSRAACPAGCGADAVLLRLEGDDGLAVAECEGSPTCGFVWHRRG